MEERVVWWETSVIWHLTCPTLSDTTGPKKLFCQHMLYLSWFGLVCAQLLRVMLNNKMLYHLYMKIYPYYFVVTSLCCKICMWKNISLVTSISVSIVCSQQTGLSWCLSTNFNGIRDPDPSKTVWFTIPPQKNCIKGESAKTWPPETLNCSKSKTCRAKKLKLYQPVYLIS